MHVPYGIPLAAWIRSLISDGKLYRFYKTEEWLELRDYVMALAHCECELCRDAGIYSRATTVHHINEVKRRPDLALSLYYTDRDGQRKRNLIAICDRCHNKEHGRFQGSKKKNEKPLTEERW